MEKPGVIRAIAAGTVGGLAGTFAMYLFGAGIFTLLGWPANTSFVIIGDSAAAFFLKLGFVITGGAASGMQCYYLIGAVLGAAWGVATSRSDALRQASFKKKVGLSILYVEAMSLPLLAAGALSLQMTAANAIRWFGISFVMHLVYGLVLGIITCLFVDSRALLVNLSRKAAQ